MGKKDFGKKIKWADIAVSAFVLVFVCILVMPAITKCIINKDKKQCEYHIYKMIWILSDGLVEEEGSEDAYWHDLIKSGNYSKVVRSLHEKTADRANHSASDYYIEAGDNKLTIRCKKHPDISEKTIKFSLMQNVNVEMFSGNQDMRQARSIEVSGPNTYYIGHSLDDNDPVKMVFKGREVDKVINNLNVTVLYTDGTEEKLPPSRYTVMASELNMNKTGQTLLSVNADVNFMWGSSKSASFVINVINRDKMVPLVLNDGDFGMYEIESRDWSDFVSEAAENTYGKTFDAAIVRYEGGYYYFPDGFSVINTVAADNMFDSARDIVNTDNAAYNIEIDTQSVNDENNARTGSVKIEDERIYIRDGQTDKGWIEVRCKIKKY